MEEEKSVFKVTSEDGEEKVYEILLTFDSNETNKSYICYTDNSTDEDNNVRVFAASFDPTAEQIKLSPIESEREWKVFECVLDRLQEENNEG